MSIDISRQIAEHFEPKPEFRLTGLSPLGWWIAGDWTNLQPRSYTDPEIVVRLLKWMIERGLAVRFVGPSLDVELAVAEAVLAEIQAPALRGSSILDGVVAEGLGG